MFSVSWRRGCQTDGLLSDGGYSALLYRNGSSISVEDGGSGRIAQRPCPGGRKGGGGLSGGMEGNFSDGCGFIDRGGVLLSFFIPDAHRTGSTVFIQYDNAHHAILDDMWFSANAGIRLWFSDFCPVPGLSARLFRDAALMEREYSWRHGQCVVTVAAGSRTGKGEPQ